MTYTINDIEQLALTNLSPEERDILADRLWSGGHVGATKLEEDPEFLAELERRIKSIEDGTAILRSHEEVMAELRARCK